MLSKKVKNQHVLINIGLSGKYYRVATLSKLCLTVQESSTVIDGQHSVFVIVFNFMSLTFNNNKPFNLSFVYFFGKIALIYALFSLLGCWVYNVSPQKSRIRNIWTGTRPSVCQASR